MPGTPQKLKMASMAEFSACPGCGLNEAFLEHFDNEVSGKPSCSGSPSLAAAELEKRGAAAEAIRRTVEVCPACGSSNTRFDYFSDKARTKGRFKCRDCKNRFSRGPGRRRKLKALSLTSHPELEQQAVALENGEAGSSFTLLEACSSVQFLESSRRDTSGEKNGVKKLNFLDELGELERLVNGFKRKKRSPGLKPPATTSGEKNVRRRLKDDPGTREQQGINRKTESPEKMKPETESPEKKKPALQVKRDDQTIFVCIHCGSHESMSSIRSWALGFKCSGCNQVFEWTSLRDSNKLGFNKSSGTADAQLLEPTPGFQPFPSLATLASAASIFLVEA